MNYKYAYPYKHYSDSPGTGTVVVLVPSSLSSSHLDVKLGELEGVFVSSEDLTKVMDAMRGPTGRRDGDPLCRRDEMPLFERKYGGRFIPFPKEQ